MNQVSCISFTIDAEYNAHRPLQCHIDTASPQVAILTFESGRGGDSQQNTVSLAEFEQLAMRQLLQSDNQQRLLYDLRHFDTLDMPLLSRLKPLFLYLAHQRHAMSAFVAGTAENYHQLYFACKIRNTGMQGTTEVFMRYQPALEWLQE